MSNTDRAVFLKGLLGKPWVANGRGPDGWDCFHLMAHIQLELAGIDFGELDMPDDPTWGWMIEAVETHPKRKMLREVPLGKFGIVRAKDLAIVLMARTKNPAHVGVWLEPEKMVIHAEQTMKDGRVVCDTLAGLHMKGWQKLRFYEPI